MKFDWRQRIIATVIFTLAAVVVAWFNREMLYYLDARILFYAIAAVPMLFLFGYYQWNKSHPDAGKRWKKGLSASFTIIIFLATVWITLSALLISPIASMTPSDNVKKYDYLANKWNSPFTAHFPRPIPKDAQTVRLFFNPGMLQSASIFELGYSTTPARVDALYREYVDRSTLHFKAGGQNGYEEPGNYAAEREEDYGNFSEDYTLFYLDEKPPTSKENWNHPHSHGVAISKKRSRVVYWAWSG